MNRLPERNGPYDVAIIGGGISGTALLYLLGKYTDLKQIALIEKYDDIASVNSHGKNNSQTLHCGDIETNYTLDKAVQVKATADMVVKYAKTLPNRDEILHVFNKMVLGVGKKECAFLRERYQIFSPHFPSMQLLERDRIAEIEPALVEGREQEIVALGVLNEVSGVDFQKLAVSFVDQARSFTDKDIDLLTGTKSGKIEEMQNGYRIHTDRGEIEARFVVVSAGGHSLLYAQQMGYGLEYSCLPVAGSFYFAPESLRGKVYTVQDEKLPFAAIHGDPDVLARGKTRFGPTALVLPMLERYNWKTIPEYFKVLHLDSKVFAVLWDLIKVKEIRRYMFKNVLFEIPFIRRWLFTRDVRKIVPGMKMKDIRFARHFGGVRPVMIDKAGRKLHLGEAKIDTGKGLVFNMTPSPGATSCLGNGEKDLRLIVDHLKCGFDEAALERDLKAD
ncbi:MAG: FAD-dependent oxidoreductase [Gammaproteobacteria bacterium]|nr:FAD-dependent oxidoreductase [Gammaproteobacteria bacterium]